MIKELNFDEINCVDGASGVVETILDGAQAIVDASYDAGKKLGTAVASLFS